MKLYSYERPPSFIFSLTADGDCYNLWSNHGGRLMRATVTQIGNSTGVILPKEVVARLKIKKGKAVGIFAQQGPQKPFFLTHHCHVYLRHLPLAKWERGNGKR